MMVAEVAGAAGRRQAAVEVSGATGKRRVVVEAPRRRPVVVDLEAAGKKRRAARDWE